MSALHAPKAPSDHLRRESARVLSRLSLIIEFRPWLEHVRSCKPRSSGSHSGFFLLWEIFALGAPLSTLLNLLSSPPFGARDQELTSIDWEKPELGLGLPHREKWFSHFIQRVQLLELQGVIALGEVLRVQDLFAGTNSGFAKAMERILNALQESFPGVFLLPKDASVRRSQYLRELVDSERQHITTLRMTGDSVELLSGGRSPLDPCLECLAVNRVVLRQYHDHILQGLEAAQQMPLAEDWSGIFAVDNIASQNAVGAYRAICANYLGLESALECFIDGSEVASHALILLSNVSLLLIRTSAYLSFLEVKHAKPSASVSDYYLQNILSVTSPAESSTYRNLCDTLFHFNEVSNNLDEMGNLLRTMKAAGIFQGRAFSWRSDVDPNELGPLLLDDLVDMQAPTSRRSLFLFEMALLCCTEEVDGESTHLEQQENVRYPILAWELGPALRKSTPLNLVCVIPTARMRRLRLCDSDSIELDWLDENNRLETIELFTSCTEQYDQWCATLEHFVPSIYQGSSGTIEENSNVPSDDEEAGGRRRSHARSWSLVGRKGPRSESSSLLQQEGCLSDQESLLSPQLLPRFFGGGSQEVSPLAINTTFPRIHLGTNELVGFDVPPTPPPESEPFAEEDPSVLLDLTGEVCREGNYPQAHGGFADVWKGTWGKQPGNWVAIKVLRSRLDDPDTEIKMSKRLSRELAVWKRLNHKHVLKLWGTVSDFGPYKSMVCPWLEQGSVSKYMERRGDILSMADRLQLLCEVADGLNYLHENSIVHGDLTGSNILIDDEGKAHLCDFGLSTIVAEICGSSSLTSCIGGAVRWADSALYTLSEDEDLVVTTRNDIYSFGSVTLEASGLCLLSGRIPYHYMRSDAQVVIELHKGNKPRRPAQSFVTDLQWAFIQRCWNVDQGSRPDSQELMRIIQGLHRASLEFRRHTY
ncbi:unnamed protein product [Mycena citricolor]|uniref:Protein kinase domain-containing protein n=1 Tax=Mycena citricolor TaxID=2018698 RepID=A0AAD2Q3G1_9AGAR|nr:unnamed protein product [Mycena citricolor]